MAEYTFDDMPERSQPAGTGLNWRDYLAILIERGWIAVTAFAAVVILSVIHTQRQTPMYRSAARILVEADIPKVLNIQDVFTINTRNLEYFNTHVKALHSRSMLEAAVKATGLDRNPGFVPGAGPGVDPAGAAMRYVRIIPVPKSRMIDVVVEHPDPKIAAILANAIAEQYIAQDLDRRMNASLEALEWLREHAEEYRGKLERGLLALQEYREQTKAVSLVERQDVVVARLKAINAALTGAETERLEAQTEWQEVKILLDAGKSPGESSVVSDDPLVLKVHSELQEKQTELALLRNRYKDKHPAMERCRREAIELVSKYARVCREAAERVESRYQMALAKERSLGDALREQEQQAFDLERTLVKYNELKRNTEADRQMYDAILARMKETSVAGDMNTSNIRRVDEAKPSARPYRPARRRNLLNSIMVGALLGITLSFVVHFADDRVRKTEEIEDILGIPILAVIPNIESDDPEFRARMAHEEPRSGPSEAFRTLRANLALNPEAGNAKRMMITSAGAAEGKSLTAANLAIVFAQDGQKTLLIDADMRRPSMHKIFNVRTGAGLSEVLGGGVKWQDAVCGTGMQNLDVMVVGKMPSNPAELLGSSSMRQVLDEAGRSYDQLVLDCPPVLGVSDPLVLLRLVEGVILVAHFNKTRRHAAARALQKLRESRTPILGAVMDNVNFKRPGAYYYYYRYGHYYHYYGDKRETDEA